MEEIYTHFLVQNPLTDLPLPIRIGLETRNNSSYRFEGKDRMDNVHCIFQYTLSGSGTFYFKDHEYAVDVGSGFLCESHDPKSGYWYPESGTEPWQFIFIAFYGQASHLMVRALLDRYGGVYRLSAKQGVIQRMRALARLKVVNYPISVSDGARLIMDLLGALVSSSEAVRQNDPDHVLVRKAHELIQAQVDQNLNATEVAQQLKVSREHLTRVFKQQVGVSPYRHIVQEKMLVACHMLRNEDSSVREIAYQLGFDSPAHFTRAFRRVIRMSPGQFRKAGVIPVL